MRDFDSMNLSMLHLIKKGFSLCYTYYISFRARRATGWKLFDSKKLKLKLLLNLDNLIDFLIWEKGVFEEEVLTAIDSLDKNEPFLFVDVGSQLGQFSLYVKKKYHQSEVLSFEPYQAAYLQQKINMQINQVDYSLYEAALSNCKGSFTLFSPPASYKGIYKKNNPGMASLLPGLLNNPKKSFVATLRLDDFDEVFGKHRCVILKMDVEGGEALVLSGGRKLLQSEIEVYIITELLFEDLPEKARSVDVTLQKMGYIMCNAQWEVAMPLNFKNGNYFYRRLPQEKRKNESVS